MEATSSMLALETCGFLAAGSCTTFIRRDPMATLIVVTEAAGKPQAVRVTMAVRPVSRSPATGSSRCRNASDDQPGTDP
jgi:hypothetical protein